MSIWTITKTISASQSQASTDLAIRARFSNGTLKYEGLDEEDAIGESLGFASEFCDVARATGARFDSVDSLMISLRGASANHVPGANHVPRNLGRGKMRGLAKFLLTFGVALIGGASGASATMYTDSFNVDPSSFVCNKYGDTELCGSFSIYPTLRTLNAGDQLMESVTYTSPLVVPGSNSENVMYLALIDISAAGGPAVPGSDQASVSSTLQGYSGPPNPITAYTTVGYLDEYVAAAGFCCGSDPNSGFSFTGVTTDFTILTSDPKPIVGLAYGYSITLVPEPATWAILLASLLGMGAMMRAARHNTSRIVEKSLGAA